MEVPAAAVIDDTHVQHNTLHMQMDPGATMPPRIRGSASLKRAIESSGGHLTQGDHSMQVNNNNC